MTTTVLSESFTTTGAGSSENINGHYNLALSGFGVATIELQASPDGGTTWFTVDSFTTDTFKIGFAPDNETSGFGDTLYRFNCTAYTSGTIVAQIWK